MILENNFVIDAPLGQVWGLFDQLGDVVACLPGAAYLGAEGEDHRVALRIKVGPIAMNFGGTMRFLSRDVATHTIVISGSAKDSGGKGSAVAVVEARLDAAPQGNRTNVSLRTDLSMAGRVAQFGGSVIGDIAERFIRQFTENLHRTALVKASPDIDQNQPSNIVPHGTAGANDTLDLGSMVGSLMPKYALRYGVPLVALCILVWLATRLF
jgi:carbon monoxide dehydrogenase subunit G